MCRAEQILYAQIELFMVGVVLGCCGFGRLGFQHFYNSFEVSNIYHCDFYNRNPTITIIPMVDEVSRSI